MTKEGFEWLAEEEIAEEFPPDKSVHGKTIYKKMGSSLTRSKSAVY